MHLRIVKQSDWDPSSLTWRQRLGRWWRQYKRQRRRIRRMREFKRMTREEQAVVVSMLPSTSWEARYFRGEVDG